MNAALHTPVIFRPSIFRPQVVPYSAAPGQTLAEILQSLPDLPPEVWTHGVITIGDHEIDRAYWARVKPKPGTFHMVKISIRLRGGGGEEGGGKNIFRTILLVAVLVAAAAVSGGALAGIGGTTLFAAGSTSAALAAAGVGLVGSLAINALFPAPSAPSESETTDGGNKATLGSASIQGNKVGQFEPIPFVTGQYRVAPPHLTPPWSESANDDQYVYAIVGLNGAHAFSDIRINDTPIDDFDDIQYETRDVINDDTDITLITQQVFENQVSVQLAGHKLKDDATDELQNGTTDDYPQWQAARSRLDPDEIWVTLVWSALIFQDSAGTGTAAAGIPIRIRIREKGTTTWKNLPELHVQRERLDAFRGMVKIIFEAAPTSLTRPDQDPSTPPWAYALYVTDTDNDELFDVDSYFAPSTGNNADAVGSEDGNVLIYLDPATFPKAVYDVQIKRGYAYQTSDFTPSTYQMSSATPYFFSEISGSSPPAIRQEQSETPAIVSWQTMASVWQEYPIGEKGISLIAIRAKNVAVSSLTAIATGYANVWDGTDWSNFEQTKNPAAWFRYLGLGGQSIRAPFVEAQLDDTSLADWYDYCGDERTSGLSFDGTSDYLTRDADLTGTADGKTFTFSFWIYLDGTAADVVLAGVTSVGGATYRVFIGTDSSNQITVEALNSAGTTILDVNSSALPTDQWVHVLGSFDLADTANRHLYINDVSDLDTVTTYTNDNIDFTLADWGIGGLPDGTSNLLAGDIAELWFETGTYLDLDTESNRRLFISDNGRPVALGSDGSTPTASSPLVYLSGQSGNFEDNKGTGGGFTSNGAPATATVTSSAGVVNRECNALLSGRQSIVDVLRIVASTGFASHRVSDKIGVVIDKDRTAETPIELFTQRNTRNLTIQRAFPRVPDGLRLRWDDEDNDYQPTETYIYHNPDDASYVESIDYIGLTNLGAVKERAYSDLRQLLRRGALYTMDVDIQNLYCTRGSLVVLGHDTLRRHYDSARVSVASISSGNLTGLTLENDLRLDLVGDTSGVIFDGTNDYLTRDAGLTGAADGQTFTFSFWIYIDAGTGDYILASTATLAGSDVRAHVRLASGTTAVQIVAMNSAGTTILDVQSSDLDVGAWHHVIGSFDLSSTANRHLYVDDVDDLSTVTTYTNDTIDFTVSDWAIGGLPDGTGLLQGRLAEVWFEAGTYLDLDTESNRRKFISQNLRPVDVGSDGSTPTTSQPLIYLSGTSTDFATNKGDGGGFTTTGALETDYLYYSDGGFPAGVVLQLKDGSTLTLEVNEEAQTDTVTFATAPTIPDYLTDQGAWATSTVYAIDDVVTNGGVAYSAIAAHTSSSTTEPDTGADWADYWEPLLQDCLVVCGPFSTVQKRMLVLTVKPKDQFTASLVLIDEAQPVLLKSPGGDQLASPDGSRHISWI